MMSKAQAEAEARTLREIDLVTIKADAKYMLNLMHYIGRVGTIPGSSKKEKQETAREMIAMVTLMADTFAEGWDK